MMRCWCYSGGHDTVSTSSPCPRSPASCWRRQSFLALAGSLKAGAHIRVTLALSLLPPRARHAAELLALSIATVCAAWAAWYLGALAYDSWRFNELSIGILPIPLWIPQAACFLGAALLAVAFLDEWLRVLRGQDPTYRAPEDAIALGKEG